MKDVIVICGATATSKTKFAVALAEKLNTEVISADCMLVYKGLDIGTAKPTHEEMRGVPHHLINVADPGDNFSVSDYRAAALPIIERLLAEDKSPIICGGTGFYIDALLYESAFGSAGANEEIRAKYTAVLSDLGKEKGAAHLHRLLEEVDPESAAILHENDVKRVIRALEIYELTGRKKSEQNDTKTPRFSFRAFSVGYPRETLYERINTRVEDMFSRGLVKEVQNLLNSGVSPAAQCMQGIGYKEVIDGILNGVPWEEVKNNVKQHTRNYAKRQITYFKRMQNHTIIPHKVLEIGENLQFMEGLL